MFFTESTRGVLWKTHCISSSWRGGWEIDPFIVTQGEKESKAATKDILLYICSGLYFQEYVYAQEGGIQVKAHPSQRQMTQPEEDAMTTNVCHLQRDSCIFSAIVSLYVQCSREKNSFMCKSDRNHKMNYSFLDGQEDYWCNKCLSDLM